MYVGALPYLDYIKSQHAVYKNIADCHSNIQLQHIYIYMT